MLWQSEVQRREGRKIVEGKKLRSYECAAKIAHSRKADGVTKDQLGGQGPWGLEIGQDREPGPLGPKEDGVSYLSSLS